MYQWRRAEHDRQLLKPYYRTTHIRGDIEGVTVNESFVWACIAARDDSNPSSSPKYFFRRFPGVMAFPVKDGLHLIYVNDVGCETPEREHLTYPRDQGQPPHYPPGLKPPSRIRLTDSLTAPTNLISIYEGVETITQPTQMSDSEAENLVVSNALWMVRNTAWGFLPNDVMTGRNWELKIDPLTGSVQTKIVLLFYPPEKLPPSFLSAIHNDRRE